MPGARMVYIPHPVQLLTDGELAGRADAIFPAVLAALTAPGTPRRAARPQSGQGSS